MRLLAAEALTTGMKKLQELAEGGARVAHQADGASSVSSRADDLAAAKALVETGLKIRRMLQKTKEAPKTDSAPDLFDQIDNWNFKPRG